MGGAGGAFTAISAALAEIEAPVRADTTASILSESRMHSTPRLMTCAQDRGICPETK
jgi:hypothetical protein